MKISAIALVLTLSFFAFRSFASSAFLQPGDVLFEDVDVNQLGGKWFAIHLQDDKWSMSETIVTTKVDEELGLISIRGEHSNTIGMLRGKKLTKGAVESASMVVDENGRSHSFHFKGKDYELEVRQVSYKYKTFNNTRNDVYFSNGKIQTLVYGGNNSGQSCKYPLISWAGDIDRDGKPDVIVNFADDSERSQSNCIFLSSDAEKGQLLKNAGCQFHSG